MIAITILLVFSSANQFNLPMKLDKSLNKQINN